MKNRIKSKRTLIIIILLFITSFVGGCIGYTIDYNKKTKFPLADYDTFIPFRDALVQYVEYGVQIPEKYKLRETENNVTIYTRDDLLFLNLNYNKITDEYVLHQCKLYFTFVGILIGIIVSVPLIYSFKKYCFDN